VAEIYNLLVSPAVRNLVDHETNVCENHSFSLILKWEEARGSSLSKEQEEEEEEMEQHTEGIHN
jgi:hypothetical protein